MVAVVYSKIFGACDFYQFREVVRTNPKPSRRDFFREHRSRNLQRCAKVLRLRKVAVKSKGP